MQADLRGAVLLFPGRRRGGREAMLICIRALPDTQGFEQET
jgi:hypothetical protein